ncbi:hypothetical protein [Kingella potus]|uniref:hypothetical protein n=1 Tax=Kingella potus TaxID=265175 RepID=UPI001FD50F1A|nr:hypothetical protein [Kingella potus]UOP01019.1 hypothetical protein LVJ84_01105 [Kingella potus]
MPKNQFSVICLPEKELAGSFEVAQKQQEWRWWASAAAANRVRFFYVTFRCCSANHLPTVYEVTAIALCA